MKSIEDRVRDATRAAADNIAPGTQPPLRLPAAESGRGLARLRRRRPPAAWVVPLTAAAAVVAVLAASLTLPAALAGHGHQDGRGGRQSATSAASAVAARGLPPYYVALTGGLPEAQTAAVVRATATGKVLATLKPPKPYGAFDYITAAGDDRTFVVAAQRYWPIAGGSRGMPAEKRDNTTPLVFFWLRIGRAGHPVRLAPLRIPGTLQATQVGGIGLSPDASKLAMTIEPVTSTGRYLSRSTIRVVTLATGASRQWHWPGGGWVGNWKPMGQPLWWGADNRTLAFQQWGGKYDNTAHVRVLDTAAPGDSLAAARLVVTFPEKAGGPVNDTLITPDGTKIAVATFTPAAKGASAHTQVTEYSARTGSVVHTLGREQGWGVSGVLWTDRTGDRLIVNLGTNGALAVVSGNTVTPLPGEPLNVPNIVW